MARARHHCDGAVPVQPKLQAVEATAASLGGGEMRSVCRAEAGSAASRDVQAGSKLVAYAASRKPPSVVRLTALLPFDNCRRWFSPL